MSKHSTFVCQRYQQQFIRAGGLIFKKSTYSNHVTEFSSNASSYDYDALMRLTVHTVDAAVVHSAPGTRQDKDTSCWTTYNAGALRRRLAAVLTEAGGIITADIIKTSPLHAVIIPLKRLRLQHGHRVPQHHPMVHA